MPEEQVVIVDKRNRVMGQVDRRHMREGNLLHRSSYVLVVGAEEKLFVQQRAAGKDLYPGLYEPGCAGVVLAGESYEQTARRELAEELGVKDVSLHFAFDFYQETAVNRVWGRVFCCRWQGAVVLQDEEVAWGGFMGRAEIVELQAQQVLTPDGIHIIARLGPSLSFLKGTAHE
ncbi:MAG: NUDIX domain-containing protein [Proteobacteria bacterium]|nr:NUDIX domain-containing protein [Pseudomonadota bacterium]